MRCKPVIVMPRATLLHDVFEGARVHPGGACVESRHTRWRIGDGGRLALSATHPRQLIAHFDDDADLVMQVRHALGEHSHFTLYFDSTGLTNAALLTTQFDGEDVCESAMIEPGVALGVGTCPLANRWPYPTVNEVRIEGTEGSRLVIRQVTIADYGLPVKPRDEKRAPPGALFLVTSPCTAR
ncbi:hypothetical protein P3W24_14595 [Luteibacter sp. PPL201]|uniref:MOSC domain-containing protein n=1 Tax=Luteibacter sahnii TaxID=3021977 RepID=A0ABT6BDN6_9GAMM|nr:hypothetical protein [Luteibacter sp. PPL193]MDY1548973.1 hypothetical protein [Luteibacter sp. PPL193]